MYLYFFQLVFCGFTHVQLFLVVSEKSKLFVYFWKENTCTIGFLSRQFLYYKVLVQMENFVYLVINSYFLLLSCFIMSGVCCTQIRNAHSESFPKHFGHHKSPYIPIWYTRHHHSQHLQKNQVYRVLMIKVNGAATACTKKNRNMSDEKKRTASLVLEPPHTGRNRESSARRQERKGSKQD